MKSLLLIILNVIILALGITPSYSASFDCVKAKSRVEKLICSNQNLSKLDEDLNDAYQKQLINSNLLSQSLIEDQRTWVKIIRNTCTNVDCLANVYGHRINEIQNFSSSDQISVTEHTSSVYSEVNDVLSLSCEYDDSKPSGKESIYITQMTLKEDRLDYVDSFKKGVNKPQHMRFYVSSGGSDSCNFPSGKSVKLKVGSGTARAYGMCGANPEIFASIWIDHKKVISRHWFAGRCREERNFPLFSLSASNDKVSVCDTTRSAYVNAKVTKPTTSCIPITDIQKLATDTIEYPLPGAKTSPVGSMELVNGTNPLCQSILTNGDVYDVFRDFPIYPQNVPLTPSELPEGFAGSTTESIFDFNNDGKLDRVFTKDVDYSYMQGNVLLIQFGKSSEKLEVDQGPILSKNSMIAACQLGSVKYNIEDCSPLPSQKADDSGLEIMGGPGEPPIFFMARYLSLYPFRYKDENYVGVNSYSGDTANYVAIIKPLPNRGFEQTCLARQVPENY